MQGIINKYSRASQVLNGIGVNPNTPSTNYAPFNDTPIRQYFENPTAMSEGADESNPPSGPIIGLPQTNYTHLHVLGMKDDIESGMDVSYYGPLQFGTPAQELSVSVDTGSADLWIPANCPSCSNAQFAPGTSSTFHDLKKRASLVYVCVSNCYAAFPVLVANRFHRVQERSLGTSYKILSHWDLSPSTSNISLR